MIVQIVAYNNCENYDVGQTNAITYSGQTTRLIK